ncbi:MAG: T9SS type A sorting domain-containing protein [Flavobacteriales bacterium]|nr:T9SS type A sorting domain-containing protein [Flavobacteriales bacterium]
MIATILAAHYGLQGQTANLVLNGSFEQKTDCPSGFGMYYSVGWLPLHGTPDYFHRCATGNSGVPNNLSGYKEPFSSTDSAYAGVATYTPLFAGGQESMIGTLTEPLLSGVKYRIRMKASIATGVSYTSCCVGLTFSPPPLPPYSLNHSDVELIIPVDEIDTLAWYQLDAVYAAQGGEDRIYIGNFRADEDSYPFAIGDTTILQNKLAYFYIDDVEIYEDTITGIAEGGETDIRVYPNPTSADIHVGLTLKDSETAVFELFNIMGARVMAVRLMGGINTIATEGVGHGMYHFRVSVNNEVRLTGKEVIVR